MTTYAVKFKNPHLDKIVQDCGIIVDTHNRVVTQAELEFLAEQIVKECILTILEEKPEVGSTVVHNQLADKLKTKFGITF